MTEQERMNRVVSRFLGESIKVMNAYFPCSKPEHFSVLIEYPNTGNCVSRFVPCSVIIEGTDLPVTQQDSYEQAKLEFLDVLGVPCDICGNIRCDGFCGESNV